MKRAWFARAARPAVPSGRPHTARGLLHDHVVELGLGLVGHGHALRVLAARWLGLSPAVGQQLVLGAGSVSVLGFEHGCPAVLSWNA